MRLNNLQKALQNDAKIAAELEKRHRQEVEKLGGIAWSLMRQASKSQVGESQDSMHSQQDKAPLPHRRPNNLPVRFVGVDNDNKAENNSNFDNSWSLSSASEKIKNGLLKLVKKGYESSLGGGTPNPIMGSTSKQPSGIFGANVPSRKSSYDLSTFELNRSGNTNSYQTRKVSINSGHEGDWFDAEDQAQLSDQKNNYTLSAQGSSKTLLKTHDTPHTHGNEHELLIRDASKLTHALSKIGNSAALDSLKLAEEASKFKELEYLAKVQEERLEHIKHNITPGFTDSTFQFYDRNIKLPGDINESSSSQKLERQYQKMTDISIFENSNGRRSAPPLSLSLDTANRALSWVEDQRKLADPRHYHKLQRSQKTTVNMNDETHIQTISQSDLLNVPNQLLRQEVQSFETHPHNMDSSLLTIALAQSKASSPKRKPVELTKQKNSSKLIAHHANGGQQKKSSKSDSRQDSGLGGSAGSSDESVSSQNTPNLPKNSQRSPGRKNHGN